MLRRTYRERTMTREHASTDATLKRYLEVGSDFRRSTRHGETMVVQKHIYVVFKGNVKVFLRLVVGIYEIVVLTFLV